MKYFIDTEFIEDFHKPLFGKRRHYIDLISIGIVGEHNEEYYAVSNEFDIDHVWKKFDLDHGSGDQRNIPPRKVYWLRENVLMPIFYQLAVRDWQSQYSMEGVWTISNYSVTLEMFKNDPIWSKDLRWFKMLLKKYGKSNKQIAKEIRDSINIKWKVNDFTPPDFYGYYADYDWVLFCSLFGRMIDLPTLFPQYCIDLKQSFDEVAKAMSSEQLSKIEYPNCEHNVLAFLDETGRLDKPEHLKSHPKYPPQANEHNAIADARWNFELYKFIKQL